MGTSYELSLNIYYISLNETIVYAYSFCWQALFQYYIHKQLFNSTVEKGKIDKP